MTLLLQAMVRESPEERNVSPSVWIPNKWVCGRGGAVKSVSTLTLFNESQVSAKRWITAVCWHCDPLSEVFSIRPFLTIFQIKKKKVWTLLSGSSYDLSMAGFNAPL